MSAYGGELLPGLHGEWVVLEREHLQAVFEREMERLLSLLQEAAIDTSDYALRHPELSRR